MNTNAHPTPSSAAASPHSAVSTSLGLLEARQARDGLIALLRTEQTALAEFLLALTDFDRRGGWEPLGHGSLFAFLQHGLGLTNGPAFYRMSAARLLQRFPEVIEPLRDGRLCLTTVAELAKVLTEENRAEVLPRFFRLSSREAQELVAELTPRPVPPMRTLVRAVAPGSAKAALTSPPRPQAAATTEDQHRVAAPPGPLLAPEVALALPGPGVERHRAAEPLTAELSRLHITVSRQFLSKLDAARAGLAHALPGASMEQALEAALDVLLEKQARARGLVKRPRKVVPAPVAASAEAPTTTLPPPTTPTLPPSPTSAPPLTRSNPLHRRPGLRAHVPASVRGEVWKRDQGRYVWPLDSGGCCGSTHRLELDHIDPSTRGQPPRADDLRLLCGVHNLLAARRVFGDQCLRRYTGSRRQPPQPRGGPLPPGAGSLDPSLPPRR